MIENVSKISILLDKKIEKFNNLQQNYEATLNELKEFKHQNEQSNSIFLKEKTHLTSENTELLNKVKQLEAQIELKNDHTQLKRQDSCSSHSASSESDGNNPNSTSGTLKRRVIIF